MSLLLYGTFGTWLIVMLIQNLKRDYGEIRSLSRWEAVGCASFLNFIVYLVFFPRPERLFSARDLAGTVVVTNVFILFAVGLATLTPHEHLKVWWRKRLEKRVTLFSEDGLPWPWIILSAVAAYALLVWGLFAWRNQLPFEANLFRSGAIQLLVVCIFTMRDVLFVQWCGLTRLRSPVIKGVLFLVLYYAASGILAGVLAIGPTSHSQWVVDLLTPAGIFDARRYDIRLPGSALAGLALQLVAIRVLLAMIAGRLRTPVAIQSASAD